MLINDGKSRKSRNVNDIAFGILDRCLDFHHKMWPSQSDDLIFEVYDRLMVMHASGDKACEQVVEGIRNKIPTDMNKASLLVTINYVVEAIQADQCGDAELATHLLMDASFWCGLMWSGQEILSSQLKGQAQGKEKQKTSFSLLGNDEKWKSQNRIKEIVYEMAMARGKERLWKSRPQAADYIKLKLEEAIDQVRNEDKFEFGEWRPSKEKITKWLYDMPAASHLFETTVSK